MDTDSVIEEIANLSPEERRRVEEALVASKAGGVAESDEAIPTSERLRRFDTLMAKMPSLPKGVRADASRDTIYK